MWTLNKKINQKGEKKLGCVARHWFEINIFALKLQILKAALCFHYVNRDCWEGLFFPCPKLMSCLVCVDWALDGSSEIFFLLFFC